MLITHTANDLAVGIAYAVASRLANQIDTPGSAAPTTATAASGATARCGPTRPFAGALLPVGGAYPWQPHRPHNLLADAFVADHSDVKGREVAYALLSAAAAT